MKYCLFDAESNGLLDKVTKIHCLSYRIYDGTTLISSGTITNYDQMRRFIKNQTVLVGHNIIQYDIPLFKKILNIEVDAFLIDTIGISYYHYPIKNFKHGLKYWGEKLGYGKPVVEDWEDQPIEVYIHRCEADVEINSRLFHGQMDYTMAIYGDFDEVMDLFAYLGFKMECLKDQVEVGIPLDLSLAKKSRAELEIIVQDKIDELSRNMPEVLIKSPPKVMYKKDGEISVNGLKWFALLEKLKLPEDSVAIYEPGNPGSDPQLKNWLRSLGWIPQTFKVSKATGKNLAQVSLPFGGGLCPSIKDMFEGHPFLEQLNDLYKARHRRGLFKAFVESVDESGKIVSWAHGLTNTLRLQHAKPCANLPGVGKWYGEEIRGCLTVPNEEYLMCGSDISGLEDNTKQHYIYFYDPKYVEDMRVPGFDAHIDIALLADIITKEDEDFYKEIEARKDSEGDAFKFVTEEDAGRYKKIKKARTEGKLVNFSATYGAGALKISDTLDCSLPFAENLHYIYWERNKAVKQTAKDCVVKKVKGQKWLYNPVSGFWYFLKAEKDRFSTLNQGTGVYVFDTWLRKVRQNLKPLGIKVCFQYHDELLLYFKKEHKNQVADILNLSMKQTNEELNLNVSIGISIDFGLNYADCH